MLSIFTFFLIFVLMYQSYFYRNIFYLLYKNSINYMYVSDKRWFQENKTTICITLSLIPLGIFGAEFAFCEVPRTGTEFS